MSKKEITGQPQLVEDEAEDVIDTVPAVDPAPAKSDKGPKLITPQESYISPEDDGEAFITKVMSDETPDREFMIEHISTHEIDPKKKREFLTYLQTIDGDNLQALWEAFKASFGHAPATITATQLVADRIKAVEDSRSLELRNSAAKSELHRLGTVAQQLSRALKTSSTDSPIGSFRVDNVYAHIATLNRDLTILNSSIIGMAEMLCIDYETLDGPDMAINAERAAKICSIVGYSAKAWANVYVQAAEERKKNQAEISALQATIRTMTETVSNTQRMMHIEQQRVESLTIHAQTYVIRNHSGNYVTTVNDERETESFRVGPFNLRITQDRSEALTFDDVETAKKVFDALQVWGRKNHKVRKLLKESGVALTSLFIGAESLVKVS